MFSVGTPPQQVSLLASTVSSDSLVIVPDGCPPSITNCESERGGTYNASASSTWKLTSSGNVTLEQDLGIDVQGISGTDTIAITLADGGKQTLQGQAVTQINAVQYWLGIVGLQPSVNDSQSSLLSSLKLQGSIPSLSFAYTAGNQYRELVYLWDCSYNTDLVVGLKKVPGSLILGGYDIARFEFNDIQFSLSPTVSKSLLVSIDSITTTINGSSKDLLPSKIQVLLDTTVTDIWLPLEACKQFEDAFHINWNSTSSFYTLPAAQHAALDIANPNVTFSISDGSSGSSIELKLPYQSFDLSATWPRNGDYQDTTLYFPLRRATNSNQYTLGRAFFQEV